MTVAMTVVVVSTPVPVGGWWWWCSGEVVWLAVRWSV